MLDKVASGWFILSCLYILLSSVYQLQKQTIGARPRDSCHLQFRFRVLTPLLTVPEPYRSPIPVVPVQRLVSVQSLVSYLGPLALSCLLCDLLSANEEKLQ